MKIRIDELKTLFRHCAPSQDDLRFQFSAIRIEGGQVISTDGHRIHVIRLVDRPETNVVAASIPAWAIRAALDAYGSYDNGAVEIRGAGDLAVTLLGENFKIEASIGREPFPQAWRQVIPAGAFLAEFVLFPKKIKGVLAKLRKLLQHGAEAVILKVEEGPEAMTPHVVTFLGASLLGEVKQAIVPITLLRSDVEVQTFSKKLKPIGIKTQYLIDALAAALEYGGEGAISVELRGELDAVVVKSSNFEAAVMPLRM